MERNKNEGYDFKTTGGLQPIGGTLKPQHEIEADLTKEHEVESVMNFLSGLSDDDEVQALQKKNRKPKLTIDQKIAMFKKDPGGTFIIKDGRKISLAQYAKNARAMNSRKNYDFQNSKDSNFEDGNKNVPNTPNSDYNSMVFNTKKVK